ncbi:Rib/alpha-like domain-containing protein, partial [Staphylococcus epidermidis]|uniref:Rib/alpha-like domain-containing protein n=1 Tax=Staphylococcus epidermidis TaxID=1282 RepID=UPI0030C00039
STLPDGNTPGTSNVDVTVTYPDGTQDHVTVPVTTNKQITMLINQQRMKLQKITEHQQLRMM